MGTERVAREVSPGAPRGRTAKPAAPASRPRTVVATPVPAPARPGAWPARGRIQRSTADVPRLPTRTAPTRIQRSVFGGKQGDAVEQVETKERFTIVDVEIDEFNDRLYHMLPDKGGERFRVYGDIRTYRLLSDVEPSSPAVEAIAAATEPPLRMSLPKPNVRVAEWGTVTEVLPGIGIEVLGDANPGYVEYIQAQLRTILETRAGAELLAQFDPARPGGRPARTDVPYQGISVLVSPPPQIVPSRFVKKVVHPGLLTADVGPRQGPKGARNFDLPNLPRIQFHDAAKGDQTIGDNVGADTGARFEPGKGGITHHKDFPTTAISLDLALYHEFIHAFLSHVGIASRIREADRVKKLRIPNEADTAEEELVVGILAGKGLPMSENAYRCERNMALRTTYLAVKITGDPELDKDPWSPGSAPKAIIEAVRHLGDFSDADAHYIVTGRRDTT